MMKEKIENGNLTLFKLCQYFGYYGENTVVGTLEHTASNEYMPDILKLVVTINLDQKMVLDNGDADFLLEFFRELIPVYDALTAKASEPK